MAIYRKSGGSNVAPSIVRRRSGSSWVGVQTVKRRSGSTWVTVYNAYTPISGVAASPSSPSGTQNVVEPPAGPATMTVSTGTVSITWNGGSGATVSWSKVSGDTMTVSGTSSASFSATVSKNGSKSAVYRATVSDGTSSGTVDVTVSLTYVTGV